MNKKIYLYHGTTSKSAIQILKSGGLKPQNKTHANNFAIITTTKQFNVVYLTKNKNSAISYGYDRTDSRGWSFYNNELIIPVVFTIEIDTKNDPLFIDEDSIVDDISNSSWTNFLLKNKIINNASESRNWLYFYKKQPELALKILKLFPWQLGLEQSGSVVFEGDINLDRIKYIDLYYDTQNYIRISDISIESFYNAYNECIKNIVYKYLKKYLSEYNESKVLPNPFKFNLLPSKYNKLDGTIYKNINIDTLNLINNLCDKYNYPLFNKIIISSIGKYYMQHNSYIKYINNIYQLIDVNKYLILDIENNNCLSISFYTYIRNNIGLLLKNKEIINYFGKQKTIIFEMKYHELKYFKNLNDFWNYVDKVELKRLIVPANKL